MNIPNSKSQHESFEIFIAEILAKFWLSFTARAENGYSNNTLAQFHKFCYHNSKGIMMSQDILSVAVASS